MQTFLPYSNFSVSAQCLDNKRLGKQRVEAYQILRILLGMGKRNKNGKLAWENHPAVKMWSGHEVALYRYIQQICLEWSKRGYKDTIYDKSFNLWKIHLHRYGKTMLYPRWLGDENFHKSHRSNLLKKNKEYYSQFGWTEPDNLPYVWPKNEDIR